MESKGSSLGEAFLQCGRKELGAVSPQVTILVLNWNGWRRTLGCLESLDELEYANFEVVVVDNGSEDGSEASIKAERPDLTVLQAGTNLGYAGGNNLGIRHALNRGADYVWVLNNDTFVEPHTLRALIEASRSQDRIGVLGAAVLEEAGDGERQVEMSAYRWRGERIAPVLCTNSEDALEHRMHPVDGVTGTSLLLDAEMLRDIGGFDERFFHYFEDAELCERARRAGWNVAYACRARVWHSVGGTLSNFSAQARYYYIRNWLLFRLWCGRGGLLSLLARDPVLATARIFGILWLLKGRWRVALAGTAGAVDAMRGRHGKRDLRWLAVSRRPAGGVVAFRGTRRGTRAG